MIQDRVQLMAPVNSVNNELSGLAKVENFMTNRVTVITSRRALLHVIVNRNWFIYI
jgi:hypothetical protein